MATAMRWTTAPPISPRRRRRCARWFQKFEAIGRYDLLQDWVAHLFSDELPEHIMYLTPALAHLEALGFAPVSVEYREGVDTLVTAVKP